MTSINAIRFCLFVFLWGCASGDISKQQEKNFCVISDAEIVRKVSPGSVVGYFFKSVGDWGDPHLQEIAFTAFDPKTGKSQNYLLNLANGEQKQIPGEYDPIGLFGKNLVSIPKKVNDRSHPFQMEFFDLRQLRNFGDQAKPIYVDPTQNGRYQSLGNTKNGFRVLTDGNGGADIRDYRFQKDGTISPIGPTRPLCRNLYDRKLNYLPLKLPMLSKDGSFLSAFDFRSQEMHRYKINSDWTCEPMGKEPIAIGDVGKLDWKDDQQTVAFHFSDRDLTAGPLEFLSPESGWNLRALVQNQRRGFALLPFSGAGTNSFFPTFLPNGNVLILQKSKSEKFSFVEVSYASLKWVELDWKQLSDQEKTNLHQLSSAWIEKCNSESAQGFSFYQNRAATIFSLDQKQCQSLAADSKVDVQDFCNRFSKP